MADEDQRGRTSKRAEGSADPRHEPVDGFLRSKGIRFLEAPGRTDSPRMVSGWRVAPRNTRESRSRAAENPPSRADSPPTVLAHARHRTPEVAGSSPASSTAARSAHAWRVCMTTSGGSSSRGERSCADAGQAGIGGDCANRGAGQNASRSRVWMKRRAKVTPFSARSAANRFPAASKGPACPAPIPGPGSRGHRHLPVHPPESVLDERGRQSSSPARDRVVLELGLGRDPSRREGRSTRPSHAAGYGFSVLSKMSVRFARLPSFAIAKNATSELPARASPS
jgi:hypothetical protein